MPMKTTLVSGAGAARSIPVRTWPTISEGRRLRTSPMRAVAQKRQPMPQPAWLEMQSVMRSRAPAPRCRGRYQGPELWAPGRHLVARRLPRRAIRHHDPEDDVDDESGPADQRAEHEGEAEDRHRDAELLGEPGAHAGDHLALARAVPRARQRIPGLEQAPAVAALDGLGADLLGAVRAALGGNLRHDFPRAGDASAARRRSGSSRTSARAGA